MEHIKKYWLLYSLLIVVAIVFIGIRKFGWFSKTIKVKDMGSNPDPSVCGGGKTSSGTSREFLCTKPLYQVVGDVKERCWTYESLGEIEPGPETSIKTPYPQEKKWYFNRQEGNKYCFVDNTSYKF